MVCDYTTPSEKEYSRGFEERLGPAMSYLNKCRPHSVSMLNAVKHFKSHLTQLPNDITDTQVKTKWIYGVINLDCKIKHLKNKVDLSEKPFYIRSFQWVSTGTSF
jgi:Initiation factor 2 subunit family.